ncbi:hypothetical protein HK101_000841 [Irineochytrium annulatum]|nr:hypothetical protein HK101_000841 [Irineochytrium annulatum]
MLLSTILLAASALTATAAPASQPLHTATMFKSTNSVRASHRFAQRILDRHGSTSRVAKSSAPLLNEGDMLWSVNVTLADGSVYSMDLDTGSSDTWIRGVRCTTESPDVSCDGHKVDIHRKNLNNLQFVPSNRTWYTLYGLGAVAGDVFTGPVTLAGFTSTAAVGISAIEQYMSGSDGLMGLGYESISNINYQTGLSANWFDNLNLKRHEKRFAFYLSNDAEKDYGEVTFGGDDPSKYTGNIQWFPVTDQSYWQMSQTNWTWAVGSQSGPLAPPSASTGAIPDSIVDTGTTLVYLPQAAADGINGAVGAKFDDAAGAYVLPSCDTSKLPSVHLIAPSSGSKGKPYTFEIPASVYVIENTDNQNKPTGQCITGFVNGGDDLGILGDIFIRAYYSIFDKDANRIGFAKAKHPSA